MTEHKQEATAPAVARSQTTFARPTNRERLQDAIATIEDVRANMVIGPSAAEHLTHAAERIRAAMQWVLDEEEQDGVDNGRGF